MLPHLAGLIGMALISRSSDRKLERRFHTAIPAIGGGIALMLLGTTNSMAPSLVLWSIAAVGLYSFLGPFFALPGGFLTGFSAASGIALINSVGNLGGFIGPPLSARWRMARVEFIEGSLWPASLYLLRPGWCCCHAASGHYRFGNRFTVRARIGCGVVGLAAGIVQDRLAAAHLLRIFAANADFVTAFGKLLQGCDRNAVFDRYIAAAGILLGEARRPQARPEYSFRNR